MAASPPKTVAKTDNDATKTAANALAKGETTAVSAEGEEGGSELATGATTKIAAPPEIPPLPGIQRAAVLLMALGEDYAAEVLKHVEPWELHKIGAAMATIGSVSREQISDTLHRFNRQVAEESALGIGSHDFIKSVLIRAVGRDRAKGVMERIFNGDRSAGLDALKWLDPAAIAGALKREHPQVVALVVSSLDVDQSAAVVGLLPSELRFEALYRVALLDTVPTQALAELNQLIEDQVLRSVTAAATAKVGGITQVADIINRLERPVDSEVLEQLRTQDPEMAAKIEDGMLVFESLLGVTDKGIQALLRAVPQDALMLALRGADEAMRDKLLRNMSKRAAALLRDDLENMAPVKLADVETAQKQIMATAKQLEDAGELSLGGGDDYV